MSCDDSNDLDVVVQIRKIDSSGRLLAGTNFPFPGPDEEAPDAETSKSYGPQGFLKASSSGTRDEARSSKDGQEVFYKHDAETKIPPGTIVPLDVTLWPMGMIFAPDEGIMLRIAGHFLSPAPAPGMAPRQCDNENIGRHHVHTGGRYKSCLILPIVTAIN